MTTLMLTNGQIASLVSEILTNPFSGEVEEQETFERFFTDVAQIVCDYCGGEVTTPAGYIPEAGSMDWATHYRLEVKLNESSPEGGGLWSKVAASVTKNTAVPNRTLLNETTQVVVFASEGVTRSVAVRDLPEGGVPCVVVDYDDMQGHPQQGVGDFERERIGCTREEFDLAASYIW
jgi:hypothetical protein